MKTISHSLSYRNCSFRVVEWTLSDEPTQLVLCLHGFGRVPEDFESYSHNLLPNERLVAIGLFSHEDNYPFTDEEKEQGLSIESWIQQVEFILEYYGVKQCKLIAYSMGGRLGLTALQHRPDLFREAHFLATDGLIRNKLYRFTVGTALGRGLAKRIKNNASVILKLALLFNRLNLLNKKLLRFVEYYMHDPKVREQVFDVWMGYRHCYPDISLLAEVLKKNPIPTSFTFGIYDAIIPWKHGRKLRRLTRGLSHVTWHKIEKGHKLLA